MKEKKKKPWMTKTERAFEIFAPIVLLIASWALFFYFLAIAFFPFHTYKLCVMLIWVTLTTYASFASFRRSYSTKKRRYGNTDDSPSII